MVRKHPAPSWSRRALWSRQYSVLGDYKPDSSEKDTLIQTVLFYRKSDPTRLGNRAQMTINK